MIAGAEAEHVHLVFIDQARGEGASIDMGTAATDPAALDRVPGGGVGALLLGGLGRRVRLPGLAS